MFLGANFYQKDKQEKERELFSFFVLTEALDDFPNKSRLKKKKKIHIILIYIHTDLLMHRHVETISV